MLKVTQSIADANLVDQIHIAAIWENGLKEYERLDEKRQVWRVRLKTPDWKPGLAFKMMRYLEWQLRIFLRFRTSPVKFVNSRSLSVLPIGLLFKIFSKSILVYDIHELETETVGSVGLRQLLAKLFERVLIRFADVVITVNESIAQWYRAEYGLKNVHAVRNIPYQQNSAEISQSNLLKGKFGIPDDEILFIYQGILGPGRGIDILLDVFAKVDRRKHIVFMGYGEWEDSIKAHERMYPNIHFHDAVSPEEVRRYTSSADVGICLIENICLSYYLSLPNKAFEYIMSGLPLIVSDFPEMRRVVDDGTCGWKVAVDRGPLLSLVTAMSWDDIIDKRNNTLKYRQTIGWHQEEMVLLPIYRNLNVAKIKQP